MTKLSLSLKDAASLRPDIWIFPLTRWPSSCFQMLAPQAASDPEPQVAADSTDDTCLQATPSDQLHSEQDQNDLNFSDDGTVFFVCLFFLFSS